MNSSHGCNEQLCSINFLCRVPACSITLPFVAPTDRYAYRPRPGIVLDDTLDYTGTQGLATQRPYAPPRHPPLGDIFDVTVSAIQGPGGASSGKH